MTDVDVTRAEDFQQEYPKWKQIEMGEIVEDDHYFYRRTSQRGGGKYVLRWPKFYGRSYYNSRFWEKFNGRLSKRPRPGQTQLEVPAVVPSLEVSG
jgi:hypothetical protein